MPQRSSSRWLQWGALAAAAALLFGALYVGRDTIDAMMGPGGARATVVSAEGGLYRLAAWSSDAPSASAEAPLDAGAAIGERAGSSAPARSARGAAARRRIDGGRQRADGAVRDRRLERPDDSPPARRHHRQGRQAAPGPAAGADARFDRLGEGDRLRGVRRHGWLGRLGGRGIGGGEPARHEQVVLSPGQQAASIPALASSVAAAVSWSPDAESYLELLGSFAKIERELAKFPAALRTSSVLLPNLPAGAVVYGTVPESRPHDRPGADARRGAVGAERRRSGRGGIPRRDGCCDRWWTASSR